MITDFFRNELFLNSILHGSQEVHVDSPNTHKVTLALVGRKCYFTFSSQVDKENDFTVDPSQLLRIAKGDVTHFYRKVKDTDGTESIQVSLSSLSRQDTFIWIKERMRMALDFICQSENITDMPSIMSEKFQFRTSGSSSTTFFNSMDRLVNVTGSKDTQFELVRVPGGNEEDSEKYDCFGLYTHPDGSKEWRPCRIMMKVSKPGQEETYRVEFKHEKGYNSIYKRENVLLSFEYKKTQENYYRDEVQEILDKLDREEVEIAELLKEQDKRGMRDMNNLNEVKKNLKYDNEFEGLRVQNADLHEEMKDDEARVYRESYVVDSYYASAS